LGIKKEVGKAVKSMENRKAKQRRAGNSSQLQPWLLEGGEPRGIATW
jgi:hypothetical protein